MLEDFNPDLGDKLLKGIKLNALLLKADGTLIADTDEQGNPKPFEAVWGDRNGTHKGLADGEYGFNFRKALIAHYGDGGNVKIAAKDYVRVWVDESNYKPGGQLENYTPKRINGGGRFTIVDTLTLSWLGTTNYIHGSISNMNLAFRPKTPLQSGNPGQRIGDAASVNGHPAHAHPDSAKAGNATHPFEKNLQDKNNPFDYTSDDLFAPTLSSQSLSYAAEGKNGPVLDYERGIPYKATENQGKPQELYVCGTVYADKTFRFDRWDYGGGKNHLAPRSEQFDPAVRGIRVLVTTYAQDRNGNAERILKTRYDYTDKYGHWCVRWDKPAEIKNHFDNVAGLSAKFMVSVDPPRVDGSNLRMTDAQGKKLSVDQAIQQELDALPENNHGKFPNKDQKWQETGATGALGIKLADVKRSSLVSGVPDGYASVGLLGWHGTIRPLNGNGSGPNAPLGMGVNILDVGCELRKPYCAYNMWAYEWGFKPQTYTIHATRAELGLIPTQVQAEYSRHSIERAVGGKIWAKLNGAETKDREYKLVVVDKSTNFVDMAKEAAWRYEFSNFQQGTPVVEIPANGLSVGEYNLVALERTTYAKYSETQNHENALSTWQVSDIDPLRITDTTAQMFTDAERAASVSTANAGDTVYSRYRDLGEAKLNPDRSLAGDHELWLCQVPQANGVRRYDDSTCVKPQLEKGIHPGKIEGQWQVPAEQRPGNYELRLWHRNAGNVSMPVPGLTIPDNELVHVMPFAVKAAEIASVQPDRIKRGDKTMVTVANMGNGVNYQLKFVDKESKETGKFKNGASTKQIEWTQNCTAGKPCKRAFELSTTDTTALGNGTVKLLQKYGQQWEEIDTARVTVSLSDIQYDNPEIILPYTYIHLGWTPDVVKRKHPEVGEALEKRSKTDNGDEPYVCSNYTAVGGQPRPACVVKCNPEVNSRAYKKLKAEGFRDEELTWKNEPTCMVKYGIPYGSPVYYVPVNREDTTKPLRIAVRDDIRGSKVSDDYLPGSTIGKRQNGTQNFQHGDMRMTPYKNHTVGVAHFAGKKPDMKAGGKYQATSTADWDGYAMYQGSEKLDPFKISRLIRRASNAGALQPKGEFWSGSKDPNAKSAADNMKLLYWCDETLQSTDGSTVHLGWQSRPRAKDKVYAERGEHVQIRCGRDDPSQRGYYLTRFGSDYVVSRDSRGETNLQLGAKGINPFKLYGNPDFATNWRPPAITIYPRDSKDEGETGYHFQGRNTGADNADIDRFYRIGQSPIDLKYTTDRHITGQRTPAKPDSVPQEIWAAADDDAKTRLLINHDRKLRKAPLLRQDDPLPYDQKQALLVPMNTEYSTYESGWSVPRNIEVRAGQKSPPSSVT
ncbi:hypothetical protein [Arcanobacterium hippocoleae]|uniref:hypothetical protein n=1 Tax=Arcanobacterium hippocoleae TaxID=149017 RepID=UPI00333FB9B8